VRRPPPPPGRRPRPPAAARARARSGLTRRAGAPPPAEIKDLTGYLRVIANPSDETAMARIVHTPPRGIGDVTVRKVLEADREAGGPGTLTHALLLPADEAMRGDPRVLGRCRAAMDAMREARRGAPGGGEGAGAEGRTEHSLATETLGPVYDALVSEGVVPGVPPSVTGRRAREGAEDLCRKWFSWSAWARLVPVEARDGDEDFATPADAAGARVSRLARMVLKDSGYLDELERGNVKKAGRRDREASDKKILNASMLHVHVGNAARVSAPPGGGGTGRGPRRGGPRGGDDRAPPPAVRRRRGCWTRTRGGPRPGARGG